MENKNHNKRFRASGGKHLKKDISRLWKEAAESIEADVVPSAFFCKELLDKCEDYNLYSHRQWAGLWRECCRHVKKCLCFAREGDFTSARKLVVEVNRLTEECHKLYK
ncbi:MAG: hypothetical protein KQH63_13140 [Desulfobulbaceae bacterium]|nr:hypothetical protein [Desulfobulbaceae bacterium]